jgi:hypothetical protein
MKNELYYCDLCGEQLDVHVNGDNGAKRGGHGVAFPEGWGSPLTIGPLSEHERHICRGCISSVKGTQWPAMYNGSEVRPGVFRDQM